MLQGMLCQNSTKHFIGKNIRISLENTFIKLHLPDGYSSIAALRRIYLLTMQRNFTKNVLCAPEPSL
jgi:hypothetical protein